MVIAWVLGDRGLFRRRRRGLFRQLKLNSYGLGRLCSRLDPFLACLDYLPLQVVCAGKDELRLFYVSLHSRELTAQIDQDREFVCLYPPGVDDGLWEGRRRLD